MSRPSQFSAPSASLKSTAIAWWLALVVGLVVTVPTASTGLVDWLKVRRGTPLWRTATAHLVAMVSATVLFLLAAVFGHAGYVEREVTTSGLLLTLAGFGPLTLGGWLAARRLRSRHARLEPRRRAEPLGGGANRDGEERAGFGRR